MTREQPRERIEPNPGDIRYVRRDARGRFTTDQVEASRALGRDGAATRRLRRIPPGQGPARGARRHVDRDVRRRRRDVDAAHDEEVPDGALRITPDMIPERLAMFSRQVPIVLGCT